LNLQHLAESALPKLSRPNEAQSRAAGIEQQHKDLLCLAADQIQLGGASQPLPCNYVRVYGGLIK